MDLHQVTDTILSEPLSARLGTGARIWLKLECDQPVQSFKIRGIGRLCARHKARGVRHLVSSSGGNAGLAAAYSGRKLGLRVTVVVPETTPPFMRKRIAAEGARVEVCGAVWDEANARALEYAERPHAALVHPFHHPDIWTGHASLIHEAAEVMPRPDVVVLSVGGGGLLCGVAQGMATVGWGTVPILAAETQGANALAAALAAGYPVKLDAITSIATTLGAMQVTEMALEWAARRPIHPVVVSDQQALAACAAFRAAHDRRVEPACGAALAVLDVAPSLITDAANILVVVCGGATLPTEDDAPHRASG